MKKEIIYSLKGIYREDYQIEGYRFGGGEKSACIVGALRDTAAVYMFAAC